MTTQSKSVLIPFLIIAGMIFAAALAWKLLGNHETKTTVNKTETTQVKPVEVKTTTASSRTPQKTPVIVKSSVQKPFMDLSEEEKKDLKKQAQSNMKFAMRYQTLEQAMSALQSLRNSGDDDIAERLIAYIETTYPNDMIPVELLD